MFFLVLFSVSMDCPFMTAPSVFSNVYSCKCLILNFKYYYSLKFVPVSNILITTEYNDTYCSSCPQPLHNAYGVITDSPACALCAQGCFMFYNGYLLKHFELISSYYNRMLLIRI